MARELHLLLCLSKEEAALCLLPYIKGLFLAWLRFGSRTEKRMVFAAEVLYLRLTGGFLG